MNVKLNNNLLKCIYCDHGTLVFQCGNYFCVDENCIKNTSPYRLVNGKPILINFKNSLIDEEVILKQNANSVVKRTDDGFKVRFRNFFRKQNKISNKNILFLDNEMSKINNPKILIVGGGEVGNGFNQFNLKYSSNIISFDIYNSINVDFIADAHQIPTIDNCFDLVIIQAVLEHVLDPYIVVNEIYRVLKHDAIVYAETPFMQQVHEGPYDFLRFTESGHRYLFRKFSLIDSGFVLGAGSSLLWSLDFFFSGIFRSRLIGKVVRYTFFWISYLDSFIPVRFNIDSACGVFFLGRKSSNVITDNDIIMHYKGNQQ